MKTDVEKLSPTRVRLTIEVPFEELKPSLDKAYREVARQVRVPGFRPGRVPPRVIDMRVGRGAVLEQAVNDALPDLYSRAVGESDVAAVGQGQVDIQHIDDGDHLTFTAEVDVRPDFELPDPETLSVTVHNAEVDPEQVENYLGTLRERFASLRSAGRPAAAGDFVSIDLSATIDGEPVEDAQTAGYSYEVGTGSMLDGLDEALTGMSDGDTKTFTAELAGGAAEGQEAEVQVTVHSVKVKDLPELDDEFAQSASEFDTIGELRAATRKQLEAVRLASQHGQARQKVLDLLLERVDMPLPDELLATELKARKDSMNEQLTRAGLSRQDYLDNAETTEEKLEEDLLADARRSVKAGFILDHVAKAEELGVTSEDLSNYVAEQAYRLGVPPDQLASQLSDSTRLAAVASDVLRGNALAWLAARVTVTDEAGRPVEVPGPGSAEDAEDAEDAAADAEEASDAGGDAAAAGDAAEAASADPADEAKPRPGAKAAKAKAKPKAGSATTVADADAGDGKD